MLDFSLNGSILRIVETSHSFNTTDKRYWYYDIVNWKKNRNGKENESIDLEVSFENQTKINPYDDLEEG